MKCRVVFFHELTFYRKIKSPLYNFLIKRIFGKDINNNFFIKNYRKLCKGQHRLFDISVVIHSIIFKMLQNHNLLNKKICTIGDGKANFVSGCLFLKENSIKIYSMNLPQALIQDYIIINKFNLIEDKLIKVVNMEEDLLDKNIKLFLRYCFLALRLGNIALRNTVCLSFSTKGTRYTQSPT